MFDAIVEAALEADLGQWALGDALRKDIASADGVVVTEALFRSCARELAKADNRYKAAQLYKLYQTAEQFPPAQRRQDVPWHVHAAAGSPQNMQPLLDGLKELGWPPLPAHAECMAALLRKDEKAAHKAYLSGVDQWKQRQERKARLERQGCRGRGKHKALRGDG